MTTNAPGTVIAKRGISATTANAAWASGLTVVVLGTAIANQATNVKTMNV